MKTTIMPLGTKYTLSRVDQKGDQRDISVTFSPPERDVRGRGKTSERLKYAGYLVSVGDEDTVIARQTKGHESPRWYKFDADALSLFVRQFDVFSSPEDLRQLVVAIDAVLHAVDIEVKRYAIERAGAIKSARADKFVDMRVGVALSIINELTDAQFFDMCARLGIPTSTFGSLAPVICPGCGLTLPGVVAYCAYCGAERRSVVKERLRA